MSSYLPPLSSSSDTSAFQQPQYSSQTQSNLSQATQNQQPQQNSNGLSYDSEGHPLDSENSCINIRHCCISPPMRAFIRIYAFVIALVLIAIDGVFAPILMISAKATVFPYIIFHVYCLFVITLLIFIFQIF